MGRESLLSDEVEMDSREAAGNGIFHITILWWFHDTDTRDSVCLAWASGHNVDPGESHLEMAAEPCPHVPCRTPMNRTPPFDT